MSSVYALEPAAQGLLTLRTTHGAISVRLWAGEAAGASRSFVQHAVDGYYAGTGFHRVVPGVLVQGGDPTGTGTGGLAAGGAALRRETHGRLKFRRRGLLALAAGDDGMCGSQFFLTLAPAPWLDGQHTIFGTVVGDTVYNLLALADAARDADAPPRLLAVDVLDNPFPDIARTAPPQSAPSTGAQEENDDPLRKVAVRSAQKLSFAADGDSGSDSDGDSAPPPLRRPKFPPPARLPAPVTPAQPSAAAAAREGKTADVAAAARAEFARLLQRGKKKKQQQQQGAAAAAAGARPAAPAAGAKAAALRPAPGVQKRERDAISVRRGRRKGAGAGEADVLRRLAGFERRVVAARGGAGRGAHAEAWFARPLALRAAAAPPADSAEYEAREGLPALGAGGPGARAPPRH